MQFVSFLHCLVGFVGHLHLLQSPSPLSLPPSISSDDTGVPFQRGQSSTKRNAKSAMSLALYIINTITVVFILDILVEDLTSMINIRLSWRMSDKCLINGTPETGCF